MKLADVLKLAVDAGLPADKVSALETTIIAEDKKAKDALEGNVASSKEIEDKRGKDRAARDKDCMDARAARDKAAADKRAADRKARDEKRAADRKARDEKFGKDRNDDPEHTNDEEMRKEAEDEAKEEKEAEDEDYTSGADPSTPGGSRAGGKTAIDSAEVDRRIAAAVAARDALHLAHQEVEPILGKVTFDSAPAAYRAALKHLAVDTKGVDDSALPALLKLAKDRATAAAAVPGLALDSTQAAALAKAIPGYDRLK
jgi:hypothetical protein